MEAQENNNMIKDYKDSCNRIACAFSSKYFDDTEFYWVANEVGGLCEFGDYYFNVQDMVFCLENNLQEDEPLEWQDYCVRCSLISHDIPTPNLKSWHLGCPRKSEEELFELEKQVRNIEKMKRELKEMIDGNKDNRNGRI